MFSFIPKHGKLVTGAPCRVVAGRVPFEAQGLRIVSLSDAVNEGHPEHRTIGMGHIEGTRHRMCRSITVRPQLVRDKKKRTISAEAFGPLGSAYEPRDFPPDQACAVSLTCQSSTSTDPSGRR